MVTIGIIAALSGVLLVNFSGSRGKARDATRISDVGQLQLAVQLYYDRCGQFPNGLSISTNVGCPSGVSLGSFISQIPTDPTTHSGYDFTVYQISGSNVNYIIRATLESTNVAVQKGLNGVPPVSGGVWSPTVDPSVWACSNASDSRSYCVTSN